MKIRVTTVLFWIATVVIVLGFIFPILWIFLTAFKARADILSTEFSKLLIFSPTLDNFRYVFAWTLFPKELLNTFIITVGSTILVMLFSLPAAYSFARWNTGEGHLLFITISTRMFPGIVAAIPFFFAFKAAGLSDTHIGVILLQYYFNISFATFLMYGFFREISIELEQAAMVDGYGRMDILRRIIFPLIAPGAAIVAVFCLVFTWNEFLFSLLFTHHVARTLSVGLSLFWGSLEIQWGPMCAAGAMAVVPTLVAAWFMQRYIVRGLTFGAVKG